MVPGRPVCNRTAAACRGGPRRGAAPRQRTGAAAPGGAGTRHYGRFHALHRLPSGPCGRPPGRVAGLAWPGVRRKPGLPVAGRCADGRSDLGGARHGGPAAGLARCGAPFRARSGLGGRGGMVPGHGIAAAGPNAGGAGEGAGFGVGRGRIAAWQAAARAALPRPRRAGGRLAVRWAGPAPHDGRGAGECAVQPDRRAGACRAARPAAACPTAGGAGYLRQRHRAQLQQHRWRRDRACRNGGGPAGAACPCGRPCAGNPPRGGARPRPRGPNP